MIYVFAALGMEFLDRERTSKIVIAIFAVVMIGYGLRHTVSYVKTSASNIRPVVAKVLASASPEDVIYVHSSAVPAFAYYSQQEERPWISGNNQNVEPEKYLGQLDSVLSATSNVWLVFSDISQNELQEILRYISRRRGLDLVYEDDRAWLYLAR